MKLEHWIVVSRYGTVPQSPEEEPIHLQGIVAGHRCIPDGRQVTTSRVVACQGDKILTKTGSQYELGRIDDHYERIYPNARERLFSLLHSNVEQVTHAGCFEI